MEFTVEFYETQDGRCPVRQFLDELRIADPGDFAVVISGLAKLRHRQNHRAPLTKPLGAGLLELRHVGKLNTRIIWFFQPRHLLAEGRRPRRQRQSPRPGIIAANIVADLEAALEQFSAIEEDLK